MEAKIVKVTDKGQISIPTKFRKNTGIKKGDQLLMIQDGKRIVVQLVMDDDFNDLLKHSEEVMKKVWDNKEDEIWDKY
ncbi:AbrB/MazE/SpoVT family DNA-binding domain-containing protein [Candidatus Woesearchaeota archaeon]|nr:AbrB/MazE/SpoVT family DNA-binding domain-containing protein [Candidatus Woesearchaeota archaeon]